jgi:hypothetical protein
MSAKPPRPSMRRAINAKCKECIYDRVADGTWREQVESCTSQDCALWILRPRASRAVDEAVPGLSGEVAVMDTVAAPPAEPTG